MNGPIPPESAALRSCPVPGQNVIGPSGVTFTDGFPGQALPVVHALGTSTFVTAMSSMYDPVPRTAQSVERLNRNCIVALSNAGGSVDNPPTLGAMASRGPGVYGHVMIVEEIQGDRFRVSEMNMGDNGPNAAVADEYRSSTWYTKTANGWAREGGGFSGPITFAPFRKS